MMAFRRVVFDLTRQIKAQARIIPRTKAKGKFQKGKFKEVAHPQSGLSASAAPETEKDIAMPGNLMTGLPVSGLMILGLQLLDGPARKLTLLGWRYPL